MLPREFVADTYRVRLWMYRSLKFFTFSRQAYNMATTSTPGTDYDTKNQHLHSQANGQFVSNVPPHKPVEALKPKLQPVKSLKLTKTIDKTNKKKRTKDVRAAERLRRQADVRWASKSLEREERALKHRKALQEAYSKGVIGWSGVHR